MTEIHHSEAPQDTPLRAADGAGGQPEQRLGTVLVADDSPTLRRIVGAVLARAGYDVVTAEDGLHVSDRLPVRPVNMHTGDQITSGGLAPGPFTVMLMANRWTEEGHVSITDTTRVVRADGSIGEYGGHPEVKEFLLSLEDEAARGDALRARA